MDVSVRLKRTAIRYASHLFPVLVAMTAGSGMLKAANLLATFNTSNTAITTVALNCNTATGATSASVVVKPLAALTGTNIITVSTTAVSGTGAANVIVTPPVSQVLSSTVTSLTYTVSLSSAAAAGCAVSGLASTSATFNFTHLAGTTAAPGNPSSAVTDVAMGATATVTSTTSGLSVAGTATVTCTAGASSTYFPGAAQTVSVTSTSPGGTPFTVDTTTNPVASWLSVTPTTGGTATTSTAVTFQIRSVSPCNSLSAGGSATTTIHLLNGPAPDKLIVVTLNVVSPSASSLVVSPTPITITCARSSGGVYTPAYPQTVSVTSTATGGTAFTVDTSVAPPAAWLSISPTSGGTATTTPVQLSLQAAAGCNNLAQGGSATTTVHLINSPAQDKVFAVTLQIVPSTILAATPNPASLTYVKGSGTAGYVDVNITSTNSTSPFFSVNTATLPVWLRLDSISGTAPRSLRFSSTTVADTLAPGTYNANVLISVSGYGDLTLPVSMLLTNKAPQLSIVGPTTVPLSWTIGQGLPTPTITAISTDTPIAYTATTGGALAPVIAAGQSSGLAYSFGTPINVSFSSQAFAAAQPGQTLTGTVTLTWGSPASTVVVTFVVTVSSPGATVSSVSPASLPVSAAGTVYTVAMTGTGFIPSTDPTQKTKVGVVTAAGSPMAFDTNISANIVNQSNITLTITVPNGTDANIPFAGGSVILGVCNPVAGNCSVATGQATLTIGTNPIIQAVTSSSSLIQGSTVSVAPYDMVSVWGANFCPNCTSTQILTGSPDPVTLTYPTALPFDSTHSLTVTFQTHSGATLIANAPILFATNSQINLLVPSGVTVGQATDIVVNYGSGAFGSSTLKSSPTFPVTIVATDPGVFTIGADGQGSGAALDTNYNLISATNPAGIRTSSGSSVSDVISLYMTGLGAPTSTGDNSQAASGGGFAYATDCVTPASYLTSFNAAQTGTPLTSLDGTLIIPSVLNTGRLVPCIATAPTVTIGGRSATVLYAGWVPGTVAGLYQINVKLPVNTANVFTTASGLTNQSVLAPVQLPVSVTAGSATSQIGVSLWVQPELLMVGPSTSINPVTSAAIANTVAATVGTALPSTNNVVTATGGTAPYTYAVTSGLLPSGLSLNATTGQISGTPAANTAGSYTVTVTATDSANIPVKGTSTFIVTVAGGLFMTNSTPSAATFGTAHTMSTVTASGGVFPYTYAMANSVNGQSLPTGLTINPATGVITTTAATPAGAYTVTVTTMDSTSGTPLTGSTTFTVVVNLLVADTTPATISATSDSGTGNYTTVSATGGSGSYTYTPAAALPSWAALDSSTGILSVTSAPAGSVSITVVATDGTTPANATSAPVGALPITITIGN